MSVSHTPPGSTQSHRCHALTIGARPRTLCRVRQHRTDQSAHCVRSSRSVRPTISHSKFIASAHPIHCVRPARTVSSLRSYIPFIASDHFAQKIHCVRSSNSLRPTIPHNEFIAPVTIWSTAGEARDAHTLLVPEQPLDRVKLHLYISQQRKQKCVFLIGKHRFAMAQADILDDFYGAKKTTRARGIMRSRSAL